MNDSKVETVPKNAYILNRMTRTIGKNILIIEDEKDIAELLRVNLSKEGYNVLSANSGEDGMAMARAQSPDLILLDLMLPGADGFEVCRTLKSEDKTANVPIIMLTAKSEDIDIVTGLEVGADDYITKPFNTKVLVARIRNAMRRIRTQAADDSKIVISGLKIDKGRHEVRAGKMKIDLTPTEFGILLCLARRPGWVFSRTQIVDAVRGEDTIITDRAIDVQIAGLRKKLGKFGDLIDTVRGIGYRFKDIEGAAKNSSGRFILII
ncbi:MAG: response regulator [Candidatus Zixiibacteriota bacterium]